MRNEAIKVSFFQTVGQIIFCVLLYCCDNKLHSHTISCTLKNKDIWMAVQRAPRLLWLHFQFLKRTFQSVNLYFFSEVMRSPISCFSDRQANNVDTFKHLNFLSATDTQNVGGEICDFCINQLNHHFPHGSLHIMVTLVVGKRMLISLWNQEKWFQIHQPKTSLEDQKWIFLGITLKNLFWHL